MSLAPPVIIQHLAARRADVFYDLYQECELWLRLALWLSENLYSPADFYLTTLRVAQEAALLHHAGNTGGCPREASTLGSHGTSFAHVMDKDPPNRPLSRHIVLTLQLVTSLPSFNSELSC